MPGTNMGASCIPAEEPSCEHAVERGGNQMTKERTTATKAIWQGLSTVGRGVRRTIVASCAAVAMIVIYGLGSIGTYGLSVAGISTLSLATSATPANARRRYRRARAFRGYGIYGYGYGVRRRRRRNWYRRRRRGIYLYW
jgi:hypothetical protein